MLGETLLSWNLLNPNNPSGKFLKSLHRVDDALWSLGSKKLPKKIQAPELEKPRKNNAQAEKQSAEQLSAEREEAKKLINQELIDLTNKIKLDSEFDFVKLNNIFEEEEKINNKNNNEKENSQHKLNLDFTIMLRKANLIPVLDLLMKEKFEKETINKNSDTNNDNNHYINSNEQGQENQYDDNSDNDKDNSNDNEEEAGEELEEVQEEEYDNNNNNINNSISRNKDKNYLLEENLEYALEKIKKFNCFYDCLDSEIKKYIESKTSSNTDLNSANEAAAEKEKGNKLADDEGAEANKKVKQHKKKNKNKDKQDNLIDISELTSSSCKEENLEEAAAKDLAAAEKKKADEVEINKLQNEFLKNNFAFDLNLKMLKDYRNNLFLLSEFLIYALITSKAAANSNSPKQFMADPKFLQLMTSYKTILEEAEKIKLSIIETNKTNKADAILNNLIINKTTNAVYEENDEAAEVALLSKISPEEMDENINLVFFSVLKLAVLPKKDELFPLDPGKLLKDFLKPMANELHVLLDFRTSSYKKINNYLKSLAKNEDLLVFSKPKGMQNDFILSVNWQAEKLKKFLPPVKKAIFLTNKPSLKDDDRENVILNKDEKIELMQMFKPNGFIVDIFKKYDKGYER